mmetsp:Transcript_36640/g.94585  ORF Transcript_36640/g.94585 Transcript_36640/m.94585 type:complete len:287 (-) Transcript_36640:262-1122(-)
MLSSSTALRCCASASRTRSLACARCASSAPFAAWMSACSWASPASCSCRSRRAAAAFASPSVRSRSTSARCSSACARYCCISSSREASFWNCFSAFCCSSFRSSSSVMRSRATSSCISFMISTRCSVMASCTFLSAASFSAACLEATEAASSPCSAMASASVISLCCFSIISAPWRVFVSMTCATPLRSLRVCSCKAANSLAMASCSAWRISSIFLLCASWSSARASAALFPDSRRLPMSETCVCILRNSSVPFLDTSTMEVVCNWSMHAMCRARSSCRRLLPPWT